MPSSSEPGAEALRPAPGDERPTPQAEPDVAPPSELPLLVGKERRETFLPVLLRALSIWHA